RSFMGFGSSGVMMRMRTGFRVKAYNSRTSAAQDWANYPDALAGFCTRLSGVTLENRPAIEVIRAHNAPETLVYLDPPYVQSTRSMRHGSCHYRHEMTDDDHRALAAVLHSSRSMIVLSGAPSDLYDCELYRHWHSVRRAHYGDGACRRTEVLWF